MTLCLPGLLDNALVQTGCSVTNHFVPINEQEKLLTRKNIEHDLQLLFPSHQNKPEYDEDIKHIIHQCPKLFAILSMANMQKSILKLREDNLSDKDLPLVLGKKGESSVLRRKSKKDTPIPECDLWTRIRIINFYNYQWYFLAPVFSPLGQHYELESDCVLPYIEDHEHDDENASDLKTVGGYGQVYRVTIHPAHQSIVTTHDGHVGLLKIYVRSADMVHSLLS